MWQAHSEANWIQLHIKHVKTFPHIRRIVQLQAFINPKVISQTAFPTIPAALIEP